MQPRQTQSCCRIAALAALLTAVSSCGKEEPYDWKNRKIGWTYAPTTGTALPEHLSATGTGSTALAKGWQCKLSDGKQLTIAPYQLERSHPQFGKVIMSIGLFDKTGKRLHTVQTEVVTAENATSTFELTEDVARPLFDLVIWFREE